MNNPNPGDLNEDLPGEDGHLVPSETSFDENPSTEGDNPAMRDAGFTALPPPLVYGEVRRRRHSVVWTNDLRNAWEDPPVPCAQILDPIEDLFARLNRRHQVKINLGFRHLNSEMAILRHGGTRADRLVFERMRPIRTPAVYQAGRRLSHMDPERVRQFLRDILEERFELLVHSPHSTNREEGVEELLQRLPPVDHLDLEPSPPDGETAACRICHSDYSQHHVVIALPCNPSHHFHFRCIERWLISTPRCPVCETPPVFPRE
ncbi:hypothetical protein PGT21_012986 [Puccinia graminis f. sp. tritici]|uniref:RING-type E3 ubiquitin transferase n=1 Tax=Puccinia graminis f. sp. tritici TaxID=56615 RepID=A0A5B0QUK5_PUCGR|nr:hypothetical protein PGT21_012986 [Puccinia graminis f. sp. tritici]